MESTHARNVGLAKFVNDCLYDTKNPAQQKDASVRNSIAGFPILLYINDELQGVYNFNLDRYSTKPYGYTDTEKCLVYEVSANSDTTAGAFYKWSESSGKSQLDYYKSDFECLYPPTRANGNDNMSELIRLIEWVNDSSDEDFKDNIGRYFNLEYLLRYYLFVLVFGAVDSLGKNMKLTTWDGLVWYPQVYDADTTIGLDNTGFLKFDMDIEMGDKNVFNTTGSQLWKKVVLLFDAELKQQYSLMRQDRFTVDNIMKYLYGEQISQIPAYYYNKDMQAKYLNFGSSYLYALHGSGEQHIRKWIRERLMYCDTLLGYRASSSDYITLRSSKLGEVYLDVETYIPMYLSIKWRDEANNTGLQTKRVGRGEKVRFTYNMPTETDQEIIVYAGHYLKSLGDVSNLQPTSMLIANADRLTEIECHSPNLINTDLSECTKLQRIDLSDCTALGTGIGAQPILNIQNCKYLRYCNCMNTQLTAIYTMQAGGNLEEIYYPETTQVVQLTNQTYLHTVGIPYGYNDLFKSITEYYQNVRYEYFNRTYDNPSITENAGSSVVSVRTKIPVEYGVTYTLVMGSNLGSCYFWEFDKNDKFIARPIAECKSYNETRCNYTPTNDKVKYVCPTFEINNWSIFKKNARLCKSEEVNVFKHCKNLANVQVSNCNAIKYLQYPFKSNDPINFDSLKYVQNLNITNSLSGLNSMQFNGFDKLRNVTLSSLKELDSIGFEDMMPVTTTSTLKNITISDCPLITSLSFNVSSDDYKVAFASNGKLDLGGLQSLKSIECNTSVKGLDTLIVPTSLTDLRFTTEHGDGINEIKNIWSASAVHNNDGFEGIDFQDMTIEFIDMLGLSSMSNAINFHIAPKTQNPNLNTARDGSESKPWFHPIGSIDLSNYTGSMIGMLRGIDLNKLDVVINTDRDQVDLTSLFECATLPTAQNIVTKTNNILAKFPKSVIWDCMFKGCDLSFSPKDITIPNRRLSLKGMYKDSNVTEDVDLPNVVIAVDEMFMNCIGITTTHENWNKTYPSGFTSTNCYKGLPDEIIDEIPLTWGGNGFEKDYTTIFELNLPNDGMTITVNNRPDLKGECNTNWGDGSPVNTEKSHTYTTAGRYIVKFRNGYMGNEAYQWGNYMNYVSRYINVPKYQFDNTGTPYLVNCITLYAHNSLESIDWSVFRCKDNLTGTITFARMNSPYITEIDLSELDLSNVSSFFEAFYNCSKLTKVTAYNLAPKTCERMFLNCSSLTEIVGMETWDMSNCDNMNGFLSGCSSLPEETIKIIETWNVSKVTTVKEMLVNLTQLTSIDISNFTAIDNVYHIARGCGNLEYIKLGGSISKDSSQAFRYCYKLTRIDNFNINGAPNLHYAWNGDSRLSDIEFKGTLTGVNGAWFINESPLSVNTMLSLFNILAEVTTTQTLTLGSANLAKLTDEQKMIAVNKGWFLEGYSTVRIPAGMDISGFTTDNNVTKIYVELTSENSTSRIAEICSKYPNIKEVYLFENGTITEAVNIFTGVDTNIKAQITKVVFMEGYFNNVALDMREYGTFDELPAVWGGFGFSKDVTSIIVVEIPSDNYEMIACGFPQYNLLSTKTINWGDGTITTDTNIHTYATAGTYTIKGHIGFGRYIPQSQIKNCLIEVKQMATLSNLLDKRNFNSAFYDCTKLTKVTTYNLAPIDCVNMFYNCSSLTEIVGMETWNMSGCTNMSNMFKKCSSLTELVGLDTWDMTSCENFSQMFANTSSLMDLSAVNTWDLSKSRDINQMLAGSMVPTASLTFTQKISNGVDTKQLFNGFNGASIDTSQAVIPCSNMAYMFNDNKNLVTLDARGFNTSSATNFTGIFNYCSKLITLDCSTWDVSNAQSLTMLNTLTKLTNFNAPMNISTDITFASNNLTVTSLMSIINNLSTITETHTLTIGSTNLAKLTDEQIAIATNKGWTIS